LVIGPGLIGTAPIGRDQAQRLARDELSKAIYHQHQSIPQAIESFIDKLLQKIFDSASHVTPGGAWTVVAIVLAVVILIAIAVRLGPLGPSATRKAPIADAGTRPLTARELREQAEASAAAADASTGKGDYTTAVLQRFRAIAISLEERGILVPDAGRTADELAAQAGRLFPGQAADIAAAARLFDDVRYGDAVGAREDYEQIRQLDDTLGRVRPGTGVVLANAGEIGGAP
jgi:Domain of unknown function (DUF4129)